MNAYKSQQRDWSYIKMISTFAWQKIAIMHYQWLKYWHLVFTYCKKLKTKTWCHQKNKYIFRKKWETIICTLELSPISAQSLKMSMMYVLSPEIPTHKKLRMLTTLLNSVTTVQAKMNYIKLFIKSLETQRNNFWVKLWEYSILN